MEGRRGYEFLEPELRSAFARLIEPRLSDGEDLNDVLAGAERLGLRRADLLTRPPWPIDVEFALAIWCWWPFKPELPSFAQDNLRKVRKDAFFRAAYHRQDDYTRLVPDQMLRLSLDELYAEQQNPRWIASWLLKPPPPSHRFGGPGR